MSNLPMQNTINQYVADGISTIYIYSYYIQQNPDTTYTIAVYVTPPNTPPNPSTDLQLQGTAYTVQGSGNITGGTITFQTGFIPVNGAIVTIIRAVQNAIDTQFSVAANFSGANLDAALLLLMLVVQQNTTLINERCLRYAIDSYLPNTLNNILPVLTNIDQQVWMSQGGAIITAIIRDSADTSLLRSQLASEAGGGGDGANLIGYNNTTPTTVHDELVTVDAAITTLQGQVGVVQAFYGASIYLSTNFGISASVTARIPFDTVVFDTTTLFNLTDHSFVMKKAGYYRLNAIIFGTVATGTANSAILTLYKNGSVYVNLGQQSQISAVIGMEGAVIDHAAIGDEYWLVYENDSSTSANTVLGGFQFTTFDIEFLGT